MEWIKTEDELPKESGTYLGWSIPLNSHELIYMMVSEGCFWDCERDKKLRGFQYWMSLPEPPTK